MTPMRTRRVCRRARIVAAVDVQHVRSDESDPAAIEARVRREARDVYSWSNGPGDRYARHEHDYAKLLYCARGSIDFVLADGRTVSLRAGDRLVLPAHVPHSANVGLDGCTCVEGKLT
jgi:quercetin dioxygenase-like cupin family protein